ncbi:hypothetical protein CSQ96_08110 [Janthinobacterium sp. BJB412]|nr:hypothetical protein CSQ96_08110 [Janthinobacterium sp. BJB412]
MAVASDYIKVAQQLYVAYFGRPADRNGLADMTKALAAAGAPTDIADFKAAYKANDTVHALLDNFGNSTESQLMYGTGSNEQFIAAIYMNVLNRKPLIGGLDFWTAALRDGTITRAEAAAQIMAAASKADSNPADLATTTNKVAVATTFTTNIDTADEVIGYAGPLGGTTARALLASVDGTTDMTTIQAQIDTALNTIANPPVPAINVNLTTGVDTGTAFTGTTGDDNFGADLSTSGTNTLNALDSLNGGAGNDSLNVVLDTTVTPAHLTSIELISATTNKAGGVTLGLVNAASVTSVTNSGSTTALTVNGIAAGASLHVLSASAATTFDYAVTTGTQAAALEVNGVTGASSIIINGVETITTTGSGSASSYTIDADSATTLAFAGAAAQTVVLGAGTLNVTKFDASAATVGVTLTTVDQTGIVGTTTVTVLGGSGNDVLTLVDSNNMSIDAGAGNDTVTVLAADNNDTIVGGAGTDTFRTTTAVAQTLAGATTTHVSGFEKLTLTTAFDGTLAVAGIDTGINTVTLGLTGGNLVAGSNDTITGGAGTFTVNLGANAAGNATGLLGGALTVASTGTAATDALVLNATAANTGVNIDATNNQAVTAAGFETVTFNTGATGAGAVQSISTLTVTPSVVTSNVAVNVTGSNVASFTTGISTSSTGKLTIDASALVAQAAGTTTLNLAGTTLGTAGTQSIIGSAGDDVVVVGAFNATIDGGLGDDAITASTTADSLSGGAGDDTITGGGGNDTILGGAGDDTLNVGAGTVSVDGGAGDDVVVVGTTLSAGDIVVGGAGNDILAIGGAGAAAALQGVSGFETLRADAALTQDMIQFQGNTTFTKLESNVAGAVLFTNVGANVTNFASDVAGAGSATSITRLLDTATNSLVASFIDGTTDAFTADNEETLSLSSSHATAAAILTDLNAADLTTLNITGTAAFTISNAITGATELATINAAAATGAVSINASTSTVNMVATGSATASSVLTTGSGNDSIVGGAVADTLTGGAGTDTINGGAGADILVGGTGADSLTGGEGADTITGGTGNDSIVLTEATAAVDHVVLVSAATNGVDTITGFTTGAGGDIIAFVAADTTVGTASAAQAVFATTAAVLVSAAAYDLAAVTNTATTDVIVLTGTTAANGDLSTSTTGSELLKLLGTADSAATGITTDGASDQFFVVAYDNGNAYLYNVAAGGDSVAAASEITLVGVISGASGAAGHTVTVDNFFVA